jgi:hypothetical protein
MAKSNQVAGFGLDWRDHGGLPSESPAAVRDRTRPDLFIDVCGVAWSMVLITPKKQQIKNYQKV